MKPSDRPVAANPPSVGIESAGVEAGEAEEGSRAPASAAAPWLAAWPEAMWHNLFYDLAFVAAILVLSGSFSVDYTLLNGTWIALVFTLLWSTWLITSLTVARMPVGPRRVGLVAVQMALVLSAAVAAGGAVAKAADLTEVIFGAMLLAVAALVRFGLPAEDSLRQTATAPQLALAGAGLAASYVLPLWWYFLAWPAAVAVVVSVAVRCVRGGHDSPHTFTHRFGELTMVVLGESFVKVGLADDADGMNRFRVAALVLIIILITTLWWGYFGLVARGAAGGAGRRRVAWAALHMPLHLGLVFLAVGLAKLLSDSLSLRGGGVGLLLIAPLVLAVLALAALSLVDAGRPALAVARALLAAAVIAVAVALLAPHVAPLTPIIASWCVTVPLVVTVAGLHRRRVGLLGRSARSAAGHATPAARAGGEHPDRQE